jgi:Right handed beta helix region
MKRFTLATATAVALLAAGTASASAATRAVDDDGQATPRNCDASDTASTTIQGAVDASAAGDTIVVCPGTYAEQVTVPADKDRLTLVSRERRQAIIKAPPAYASGTVDLVRVDGAENVSFASFVITGPQPDTTYCNPSLVSNVRIGRGGSANLVDNRITQAKPTNPALRGCQNGFGVQIGRTAESDTGTGRLYYNEIDDYNKGGVYVDNTGSKLIAVGNTVRGPDQSQSPLGVAIAATNGIQISRNADAFVERNRVIDNVFPGFDAPDAEAGQASGFILFDNVDSDIRLRDNDVQNNDTNLGLYNSDNGRFEDNSLLDAVVYDGIYADEDSAGNRFEDNTALRNAEHDCHDDSTGRGTAGTANVWRDNRGETSTPEGLCKKKGHRKDDDD